MTVDGDDASTDKREKKLTEKGRIYQLQNRIRERDRLNRKIRRCSDEIGNLLELRDVRKIDEAMTDFKDLVKKFEDVHEGILELADDEEISEFDSWFDAKADEFSQFRIMVTKTLKVIEEELELASSEKSATVTKHQRDSSPASSVTSTDVIGEALCKLLKLQTAPEVTFEPFDGNPLNYHYFMAMFKEVVESKVDDPTGKLTRLIQYTVGEPHDLISSCIQYPGDSGYLKALELLEGRYGDPYQIMSCYRKEIKNWPNLKFNDAKAFRKYHSFLVKCQSITISDDWHILDGPETLCILASKLPGSLIDRWNRRVMNLRKSGSGEPRLQIFIDFIDQECRLINDPLFSRDALRQFGANPEKRFPENDKQKGSSFKNFGTIVSDKSNNSKGLCLICDAKHDLDKCETFLSYDVNDRSKFLFRQRLCFGCYSPTTPTHNAKSCPQRRKCEICKMNHPTGLHGYRPRKRTNLTNSKPTEPKVRESTLPPENLRATDKKGSAIDHEVKACNASAVVTGKVVSICVVPVEIISASGNTVKTLAMLDNCSEASFATESLKSKLGISGRKTLVTVETMIGSETSVSEALKGLSVRGNFSNSEVIEIDTVFTQKELPTDAKELPTPDSLAKWDYLKFLNNHLSTEGLELELLIGADCPKALEPRDVVPSRNGGPYAFKTALGWCVVGPIRDTETATRKLCNRIAVRDIGESDIAKHHFEIQNKVKETEISEMLKKLYNSDFNEPKIQERNGLKFTELSIEDIQFLERMDSNIEKVNKQYSLPLPFRDENISLPNNREVAIKRLRSLKRRLMKENDFYNDYKTFMDNLLSKGYAEKVKVTPIEEGQVWYLPHHGVYHPNKPGKIRVVFDCGSEFQGETLNKNLLSGPDLTNQLVGVLSRFRKEHVAVMADIEAMYHQVLVKDSHRSFLRFFWWEEANLENDPVEFQMNVHVFGATSSASCSSYALKKTAIDNRQNFSSSAFETIHNDFYVDDMLKSEGGDDKMISLVSEVKQLCLAGGFNLTKFISNSKKVLASIDEKDRKTGVKDCDLAFDSDLPTDRALGILWNVEQDAFRYHVNFKIKPLTRRGMLSVLSSLYDPLGFISPFLLRGKMILQELCAKNLSWDDPIDDFTVRLWNQWKEGLNALENVQIPRCLKPVNFGNLVDVSLHHFSDASEKGYGQASYIRLVDENDQIHCALLMGKSRVTPAKFVSVPRLELTAARLSVSIATMLNRELKIPFGSETFWTDSQVVLAYLKNTSKRFKIFVANRIQAIRDNSNLDSWKYVPSKENPSDLCTRGSDLSDKSLNMWFNGPKFLWSKDFRPNCESAETYQILDTDPEVKKVKVNSIVLKENFLDMIVDRISSWNKIKRVVAWILRLFRRNPLPRLRHRHNGLKELEVKEIREAELKIILLEQAKWFSPELKSLKNDDVKVLQNSKLSTLNPFVDENGIIRVGGRIENSNLDFDFIHPIVLPKESKIARLMVNFCHIAVAHSGRGSTINEVRDNGYWVIGINSLVKSLIFHCVRCRYLRGKISVQLMASLPKERMEEAPPFSYNGVDCFGPFIIKERRKELKRYGVMFTCLASRAVHIEVVSSLETDTFILALRRFISRRGNIRFLRSDNGTNFVGANKELIKAWGEMDQEKIRSFLSIQGADYVWKFNPPAASHMGGVWERQIRSARAILTSLLKTHSQSLNDESLHTLLTETEAIINSRPLTVDTINDPNSLKPLSPSNLLTMKSKVVLPPPGSFSSADLYSKKRWRRVQHIANEFWSRWRKEFLQSLQKRTRWSKPARNYQVNDVVLLKDDSLFVERNSWPMARVKEVYPGSDGIVRVVKLMLPDRSCLNRPITKLVLLLENDLV